MAVRTYFWQKSKKRIEQRRLFSRTVTTAWHVGNAGDIYNADLINHLYGENPTNLSDEGRRILLVGSTVRQLRDADMVAGIGVKGHDALPEEKPSGVQIRGVRGPLTEAVLRDASYDLSELAFYGDPGLLIAQVFPSLREVRAEAGKVGFVPHYRETAQHRSTTQYDVIDADASAHDFAREIARCEAVYSSSLHGVIFAHALGRPAALVSPRTKEPEFKYRDYYASVGLPWQPPSSIAHALRRSRPTLPDDIDTLIKGFNFPHVEELRELGIAE